MRMFAQRPLGLMKVDTARRMPEVRWMHQTELPKVDAINTACFGESALQNDVVARCASSMRWPVKGPPAGLGLAGIVGATGPSPRDVVAAMLLHIVSPHELTVLMVAVDPGFRRQGFARAMFDELLQHFGESHTMHLTCQKDNVAAVSLYKSLGFCVVTSVIREYYASSHVSGSSCTDAIGMMRQPRTVYRLRTTTK